MNDNVKLFDEWSSSYDEAVKVSESNNTYPFAGYSIIQELIYKIITKRKSSTILEMGIGTGRMTFSLYKEGYDITGVDSSVKMIHKAIEIMPKNNYIHKNFIDSLQDLKEQKFDVIIFTYSIHHINTKNQEDLLLRLSKHLNNNGEIIIGDVMTNTNDEMKSLSEHNKDIWDFDEYYPTLENYTTHDIGNCYELDFQRVTFCSGITTLRIKE